MKGKSYASRRRFLKSGITAATGWWIVPRHVMGRGHQAPSDKVNIAGIGTGGKGISDIENAYNMGANNIVALCDVDDEMSKQARNKWPSAKYYSDFRKMLDALKGTVDGVTISTPDHTHAAAAMYAMERGIHVYVQKPLTHNIAEARLLTESARKYKIVSQMGNQGASNPDQVKIKQWVDSGKLGLIETVYVYTNRPVWPQGIAVPTDKPSLPATMSKENWNLFIGPAQYVDYHPLYHPFKWRGWWNFGTGALGDMGCHIIDIPVRALELGYPTEVECSVGQIFTKDWIPEYIPEGCPPSSTIQLKFNHPKMKGKSIKMIWTDGGIKPFHPDLVPADINLGDNGIIMVGSKGVMHSDYFGKEAKIYYKKGGIEVLPKGFHDDFKYAKLPEYGHQVAWCDAIKAGFGSEQHKSLTSSFDYSGPMTEAVLMGNLAIRSFQTRSKLKKDSDDLLGRKKLLWDGNRMKITNYDEANEFVGRQYREW